MSTQPQTSAKAVVAAITAALLAGIGSLGTVITGNQTLAAVTTAQWLFIIGSIITAAASTYGVTWSVTNAPAKAATPPVQASAPSLPVYIAPDVPPVPAAVTAPAVYTPPRDATAQQIIDGDTAQAETAAA